MLKSVSYTFPGSVNFCNFLISRQERLKFYLGKSAVVAINDGSIIIKYSRTGGRLGTWGIKDGSRIIKPVISIEVFSLALVRLKSRQSERGQKV